LKSTRKTHIFSIQNSGKLLLTAILVLSFNICIGQGEYALLGDQNLVVAKLSSDKDSINKSISEAIINYNKELEVNPRSSHAYSGRAEAKYMLKDYRGAIGDCMKAEETGPGDVNAYRIQGKAELELGDFNLAIRDFSKAIDLNPHHSEVSVTYYLRGNAKSELGNDAAAILDYNLSIEITPAPETYLKRGICKLNLANKKGACEDWGKSAEMGSAQANIMIGKFCR
jgi:tetratricopeptide (TPR) repeat protein